MLRLLGLGPELHRSHKDRPDGLLLHEDVVWALFPPQRGARQYWRDLDSLEAWTRTAPHRDWWQKCPNPSTTAANPSSPPRLSYHKEITKQRLSA
ncbi:DUF4188 domain-containing protein [Nocardia sp. NPDC005745]|uniref:monooxygenase family protein n=1 Tax=Nocardia sp. NPDC005745 TaxID=3157061 RepID=UPI0033CF7C3E